MAAPVKGETIAQRPRLAYLNACFQHAFVGRNPPSADMLMVLSLLQGLLNFVVPWLLMPQLDEACFAMPTMRQAGLTDKPNWIGVGNRASQLRPRPITQAFGYTRTRFADDRPGEIGGTIVRAATPAWYARPCPQRTLTDRFSASGTFAIRASESSSGAFIGWFNAKQPHGIGRPLQSLGLHLDGEASGLRLAIRIITASNRSCGTYITPFVPGGARPTPIRNDGTRYHWSLTYDPEVNASKCQLKFHIKSLQGPAEPFETRVFTLNLPAGFQAESTRFDRFGVMSVTRPGNPLRLYLARLKVHGQAINLNRDPHWEGQLNQQTYEEPIRSGVQNFGWNSESHRAQGDKPGEIGGWFWRTDRGYASYVDRVGPLRMNQPLRAKGKVILVAGAPDSNMAFGWFTATESEKSPAVQGPFLGICIGGPTRVGHYFLPQLVVNGERHRPNRGPLLRPGHPLEWSLVYDPLANHGVGVVTATLGNEKITLPLPSKAKRVLPALDQFGLLSTHPSGGMLQLYLDDICYTAQHPK